MIDPRRILRNSFFITGSVVAGGLLLFPIFVMIARYLSVARFGQFVFILTLASIFQLFADGGILNVTIRDLARSPAERDRMFGSTRALVWVMTIVLTAVVWFATRLLALEPDLRIAAWCMGAAALMALHGLLYAAVARAFEDMGSVALAGILHKVILLLLVWLAIVLDAGIEGVALAHTAANLLQWVFFSVLVRRRYTRAPLRIDFTHWWYVLREAVPMGVGMVLRRMTVHLGTFLLAALAGAVAVGLYNSAYRFIQMIEIGAVAATGVLFPVFSRLAKGDAVQFKRLYGDTFRIMLVLAAPMAGVLLAFGDDLVLAIYGKDFAEAGAALQVLGAALVFLVPSAVMHSVFSAIGKQTLFMRLAIVGVCSNALFGLLLIPSQHSLGAALATLATEIILFFIGAYYLKTQQIATGYVSLYLRVLAVMGGLSVLGLWVGQWIHNLGMLIAACAAYLLLYAALIPLCRIITPKELAFMRNAARPQRPAID